MSIVIRLTTNQELTVTHVDDTRSEFLPTRIASSTHRRLHHVTIGVLHEDVVEIAVTVTPSADERLQAVVTRRKTDDVLTYIHRTAGEETCVPSVGSTDKTSVIIVHIETICLALITDALEPLVLHILIVQHDSHVRSNLCASLVFFILRIFQLVSIVTVTATNSIQPSFLVDGIIALFVLDNLNTIVHEPWVVNHSREVLGTILVSLLRFEVVTTCICEFIEVLHAEVVRSSLLKVGS